MLMSGFVGKVDAILVSGVVGKVDDGKVQWGWCEVNGRKIVAHNHGMIGVVVEVSIGKAHEAIC